MALLEAAHSRAGEGETTSGQKRNHCHDTSRLTSRRDISRCNKAISRTPAAVIIDAATVGHPVPPDHYVARPGSKVVVGSSAFIFQKEFQNTYIKITDSLDPMKRSLTTRISYYIIIYFIFFHLNVSITTHICHISYITFLLMFRNYFHVSHLRKPRLGVPRLGDATLGPGFRFATGDVVAVLTGGLRGVR